MLFMSNIWGVMKYRKITNIGPGIISRERFGGSIFGWAYIRVTSVWYATSVVRMCICAVAIL